MTWDQGAGFCRQHNSTSYEQPNAASWSMFSQADPEEMCDQDHWSLPGLFKICKYENETWKTWIINHLQDDDFIWWSFINRLFKSGKLSTTICLFFSACFLFHTFFWFYITSEIESATKRNREKRQMKECRKTQLQRADVFILHLVCKNKTKHVPLHLIFS